jgi:hypothetical protein
VFYVLKSFQNQFIIYIYIYIYIWFENVLKRASEEKTEIKICIYKANSHQTITLKQTMFGCMYLYAYSIIVKSRVRVRASGALGT